MGKYTVIKDIVNVPLSRGFTIGPFRDNGKQACLLVETRWRHI